MLNFLEWYRRRTRRRVDEVTSAFATIFRGSIQHNTFATGTILLIFVVAIIPHSVLSVFPFEHIAFYTGPRNHFDYLYLISIGKDEFARAYLNGLVIQEFLAISLVIIHTHIYVTLLGAGNLRSLRGGALIYIRITIPIIVGIVVASYFLFFASDALSSQVSWFVDKPDTSFLFMPQPTNSFVFITTSILISIIGMAASVLIAILMSAILGK